MDMFSFVEKLSFISSLSRCSLDNEISLSDCKVLVV